MNNNNTQDLKDMYDAVVSKIVHTDSTDQQKVYETIQQVREDIGHLINAKSTLVYCAFNYYHGLIERALKSVEPLGPARTQITQEDIDRYQNAISKLKSVYGAEHTITEKIDVLISVIPLYKKL